MQQTLCWREMDSNHRYRIRNNPFGYPVRSRNSPSATKTGSFVPGTDGSNPFPSSGESIANLTSFRAAEIFMPSSIRPSGFSRMALPIRQYMHQQPPTAAFSPKRSSSAAHKSGVSGRIVSFVPPHCPSCSLSAGDAAGDADVINSLSRRRRRPSVDVLVSRQTCFQQATLKPETRLNSRFGLTSSMTDRNARAI